MININTWEKPTWFVEKNPKKMVPVLEQDDKIVYESLIASQYLEDIYPDKNPLSPKDPYLRAKDAILLDFFGDKVSCSWTIDKINLIHLICLFRAG